MKLNKLKEKFVVCDGCRKISTINYTDKHKELTTTCLTCDKITTYKLNKHDYSRTCKSN